MPLEEQELKISWACANELSANHLFRQFKFRFQEINLNLCMND